MRSGLAFGVSRPCEAHGSILRSFPAVVRHVTPQSGEVSLMAGRSLRQSAVRAVARDKGGTLLTWLRWRWHGDVKPIQLLHGVALALIVARGISLLGLLLRGVVERLAHDDSARRASSGDGKM